VAEVRGAQHFTFTLSEAVDALVAKLRADGVVVGPIGNVQLNIVQANSTVQLLIVHPIASKAEDGRN
jgi:hypothetical protein